MTSCTSQLTLDYLGCRIQIAAEPGDLQWLQEFLSPPFVVVPSGSPHHRVVYTTDAARYTAVLTRGPDARAGAVPCFAFDRRKVRYPRWRGEDGEVVLFDNEFRSFYVIAGAKADVELVAHRDNRWPRVALMRVVREIATAHAEANAAVSIHGAAVAKNGKAVVLAGPKRSGKTTLLLHMLMEGGSLVANDRVLVRATGEGQLVTGMPTVVNVRKPTRALLPEIFAEVRDDPTLASLTSDERAGYSQPLRGREDGALVLTPAQLCEFVGAERADAAELAAILLPRVDEDATGIELTRLAPEPALERMTGATFPSAVRLLYTHGRDGATPGPVAPEALSALASSVACFDCVLGRDAYSEQSRARLMSRLFGSAT